jgi:hypothetical protein
MKVGRVGSVQLDGKGLRVELLPVYPAHPQNAGRFPPMPCRVGPVYWSDQVILVPTDGPGCEQDRLLLDPTSWKLRGRAGAGGKTMVAPGGSWYARWGEGTYAEAYPLGTQGRTGEPIPIEGDLIHWDAGRTKCRGDSRPPLAMCKPLPPCQGGGADLTG